MRQIEIIITLEDFKTFSKFELERSDLFSSRRNCPLAVAIKRVGITENPKVGIDQIFNGNGKLIGIINPQFKKDDFDDLFFKKITEFKTTFTFY